MDDEQNGMCDYNPYTSQMNRRMELIRIMEDKAENEEKKKAKKAKKAKKSEEGK